jgi:hypothetical protein
LNIGDHRKGLSNAAEQLVYDVAISRVNNSKKLNSPGLWWHEAVFGDGSHSIELRVAR